MTTWNRTTIANRPDIIGVRRVDGGMEFLCFNDALNAPFYTATDGKTKADSVQDYAVEKPIEAEPIF